MFNTPIFNVRKYDQKYIIVIRDLYTQRLLWIKEAIRIKLLFVLIFFFFLVGIGSNNSEKKKHSKSCRFYLESENLPFISVIHCIQIQIILLIIIIFEWTKKSRYVTHCFQNTCNFHEYLFDVKIYSRDERSSPFYLTIQYIYIGPYTVSAVVWNVFI